MKLTAVLLFLVSLLAGCGTPQLLYEHPLGTKIYVAGTPTVMEDGYRSHFWFEVPDPNSTPHTIQDVDLHQGWVGVEAHKQPMWLPDFHYHWQDGPEYFYSRRDMFMRPGEVSGVDWHFKGVAMVSGWPQDEESKQRFNRNYWYANEMWKSAKVVWEAAEAGIHWRLEFFPAHDEQLALLKFSIPGTPVYYIWDRNGLVDHVAQVKEEAP